MRLRAKKNRSSRGAAAVEMTLVIILFLTIVISTIYLGMYSVTKSLVDVGIGSALDLAATHPGLNDDFPVACSVTDDASACCAKGDNSSTSWCIAHSEIEQEALKIPKSTILKNKKGAFAYVQNDTTAIDVNIPIPLDTLSAGATYRENPIEVIVTYNVLNLFGEYDTLERKGYIFYETSIAGADNTTVDCHGNPKGSPQFMSEPCECDASKGEAKATVAGIKQCVLCTSIKSTLSSVNTETFVSITGSVLPANHPTATYNYGTFRETGCYCPSQEWCANQYTPDDFKNGSMNNIGVHPSLCRCQCLNGFDQNGTWDTTCVCGGSAPASYPTGGYDTTYPAATFETEKQEVNGKCVCKIVAGHSSGEIVITNQMCNNWFPAAGGAMKVNSSKCGCTCHWSSSHGNRCKWGTRNNSDCSCTCPAGRVQDANGDCVCDQGVCEPGSTANPDKGCRCEPDCSGDVNAHYNSNSNVCQCNCGDDPFAYPSCTVCGNAGSTG